MTGRKWAFNYKHDSVGSVNRSRARFGIRGFTQVAGVAYEEIYAPCPSKATVRAVMAVVAQRDMKANALDMKHAYLNAHMDKPLYTRQPKEYEVGGDNMVCRCKLALNGSKQAGNLWNTELHNTLTSVGSNRSDADPNLYL